MNQHIHYMVSRHMIPQKIRVSRCQLPERSHIVPQIETWYEFVITAVGCRSSQGVIFASDSCNPNNPMTPSYWSVVGGGSTAFCRSVHKNLEVA